MFLASSSKSPFSTDPNGTLFIQDGRVFRDLSDSSWNHLERIRGHIGQLEGVGLVPSTVFDAAAKRLEHKCVPFVSYPGEWTMPMMKEAVLCLLNISAALEKLDSRLHDAHPWNITFMNGRPIFLDFSSIENGKTSPDWWIKEFFLHCYLPLKLASTKRFRRYGYDCLSELHPTCVPSGRLGPVKRFFSKRMMAWLFHSFQKAATRYKSSGNLAVFLAEMIDQVNSFDVKPPKSEWSEYPEPELVLHASDSDSPKTKAIKNLLQNVPPGRLLDIGCNSGWLTTYASLCGHTSLGIDLDEFAVEKARQRAKANENVNVALANPINPSPPFGPGLRYASALDRWQADTVVMLAVSHHFCIRQNLTFSGLVELARMYGAKQVVVEFIPRCDPHLEKWVESGVVIPPNYCESEFTKAWLHHFRLREACWTESTHAPVNEQDRHRKLFLFEAL